jgi:hypothetical protein
MGWDGWELLGRKGMGKRRRKEKGTKKGTGTQTQVQIADYKKADSESK